MKAQCMSVRCILPMQSGYFNLLVFWNHLYAYVRDGGLRGGMPSNRHLGMPIAIAIAGIAFTLRPGSSKRPSKADKTAIVPKSASRLASLPHHSMSADVRPLLRPPPGPPFPSTGSL
jgi:hypothetical protein